MRLKIIDSKAHQVSVGFTIDVEAIPRVGEIIQNANGLQFQVENVLHRKHDHRNEHVVELFLSEALK